MRIDPKTLSTICAALIGGSITACRPKLDGSQAKEEDRPPGYVQSNPPVNTNQTTPGTAGAAGAPVTPGYAAGPVTPDRALYGNWYGDCLVTAGVTTVTDYEFDANGAHLVAAAFDDGVCAAKVATFDIRLTYALGPAPLDPANPRKLDVTTAKGWVMYANGVPMPQACGTGQLADLAAVKACLGAARDYAVGPQIYRVADGRLWFGSWHEAMDADHRPTRLLNETWGPSPLIRSAYSE